MRRLVLVLSDTHAGHRFGLMNPAVELPEEDHEGKVVWYTPRPSEYQEFLWEVYTDGIRFLQELAHGDEIVVVHNGDATQGMRFPQHWVSSRLADQVIIAVANLDVLAGLPEVRIVRLTKGTGSHVFEEGSSEILIAQQLQERHPERDVECVYHGLLDVDGVTIDYAHHGPSPGLREWTRGNVARHYLRSEMYSQMLHGERPARVVMRSHMHTYTRETLQELSGDRVYTSDLIITPAFCGLGDHGHRATRSAYEIRHGFVVLEIVDGQLVEIHPLLTRVDLRTKERV